MNILGSLRDPKPYKLLFEIGTDSDNDLLDGRVGNLRRGVRRYTKFIGDILLLAEPQWLFFGIMLYNILYSYAESSTISSIYSLHETVY